MTTLQLSLIAGALIAAGLITISTYWLRTDPDLRTFLTTLEPTTTTPEPSTVTASGTRSDRIGLWIMRTLPTGWLTPPKTDLAVLRKPLHQFYGEKVTFALVGLALPIFVSTLTVLAGVQVPIAAPIGLSLALAAAFSFIPDYNIRTDARDARLAFRHALAVYIDLVSMERRGSAAPRQAMEDAATSADSWFFQRILEVLRRSRMSGVFAWDALADLGADLDLPDLIDIADTMRLAGDDQVAIYNQLRARAAALRDALRTEELSKANSNGVKIYIPLAALGALFLVILGAPPIMRLIG